MDWTDRAVCRGNVGPELFTGEDIIRAQSLCNETIRTFCSQCPVQIECGEWALSEPFFEGIAGGLMWSARGIRKPYGQVRPRPPAPAEVPTKPKRGWVSPEFDARGWA